MHSWCDICIYTYIHIYIYIHVYIYIHIQLSFCDELRQQSTRRKGYSMRASIFASSGEAVVNRDPKGERILELLQENKALRAKVARLEAHIDRCLTVYFLSFLTKSHSCIKLCSQCDILSSTSGFVSIFEVLFDLTVTVCASNLRW